MRLIGLWIAPSPPFFLFLFSKGFLSDHRPPCSVRVENRVEDRVEK